MIEGIIFDFDGLMIDSEVISYKCYNEFLKNYNITLTEEDYANEYPGKTIRLAVQIFNEKYHLNCNTEQALDEINKPQQKYIDKDGITLKKGLLNLLEYIKSNGYKSIIATSSTKNRALKILNTHGLEKYFDDLVFGYEVKRGKPFPDIFIKACQKLNIKPENAIVLEDSEAGIQAAYQAHIPVICIPDMKYPKEEFADKTTAILQSLDEVIKYLN